MDRAEFSRDRIAKLAESLESIDEILDGEPLCIYATGSYGRLEAWAESDADVFFLYQGHPDDPFSRLTLIEVSAKLIEAAREMEFPKFSRDGRYLDVHYLDQMEEVLGSPDDDSLNAFTARMLLLLESRPIFAAERYRESLRRVVDFYFRDFADHADSFRPTFLLNDILRFWRTLTLNYEHDRYEISQLPLALQAKAKAKSALKNYKLKESRLATCFSMALHLAARQPPVTAEQVLDLCEQTPRERLLSLSEATGNDVEDEVAALLENYEAFLDHVQRPEAELLDEFQDSSLRSERMDEAGAFGDQIFDLLLRLVPRENLRQLVL